MSAARLAALMQRWRLVADGAPFVTRYGNTLAPVRTGDGRAAMLKLIASDDEKPGVAALRYFAGQGAAALYESDADAELMQRLAGPDLTALARADDERATHILCDVLEALHAPRRTPPPEGLHDLSRRFRALERAAARADLSLRAQANLRAGWETAAALLAAARAPRVLHGDMHHENVLADGDGGWRAIDPKGVWGDPGYDYANIFLNPIAASEIAIARVAPRAAIVAARRGADPVDVLAWAEAHAMLSAAWTLEEGGDPAWAWDIAEIARAERGA